MPDCTIIVHRKEKTDRMAAAGFSSEPVRTIAQRAGHEYYQITETYFASQNSIRP